MGMIRKRASGRYQAVIRRKGHKTLSKTFATKELARAWTREQEVNLDSGNVVSLHRAGTLDVPVNDLLDVYDREHVAHKRKPEARKRESSRVKILKTQFDGVTLRELDYKYLVDYGRQRRKKLASASVTRDLDILSNALQHSKYLHELPLPVNPVIEAKKVMRKLGILEKPVRRDRVISDVEMEKLYADLQQHNPNVLAAVKFTMEVATRRGEVAKLRWCDLNYDTKEITLRDTKAGKDQVIPMTLAAQLILAAVPKDEDAPSDTLVFGLKPDSITQAFRRAAERCGIRGLRVHDLRHSAASRWIGQGLSIKAMQGVTRHASLDSLGKYLHLDRDMIRENMDALVKKD